MDNVKLWYYYNESLLILDINASSDSKKLIGTGCDKKITVNIPKSNNSNLYDLKVDGKNIDGFSKDNKNYNLGMTDADKINISVVVEDSRVSLSGVGENTITIDVTVQNGKVKTYKILVLRKADSVVVTIDKLLDVLKNNNSKNITVEIRDDSNNISKDIMDELSNRDIVLMWRYTV